MNTETTKNAPKLYTNRDSAARAARRAGLKSHQYRVVELDGKFSWYGADETAPKKKPAPKKAAPKKAPKAPKEPKVPKVEAPKEPKAPAADPRDDYPGETAPSILRESYAENPVALVWELADKMHAENPNIRRKDVVNEAIKQGVAYYTARTQYQRWFTAQKKRSF